MVGNITLEQKTKQEKKTDEQWEFIHQRIIAHFFRGCSINVFNSIINNCVVVYVVVSSFQCFGVINILYASSSRTLIISERVAKHSFIETVSVDYYGQTFIPFILILLMIYHNTHLF